MSIYPADERARINRLECENRQLRRLARTNKKQIELALLRRMATKGMTVDFSLNGGWEDLLIEGDGSGRYGVDTIASGSTLKKLLEYVEG